MITIQNQVLVFYKNIAKYISHSVGHIFHFGQQVLFVKVSDFPLIFFWDLTTWYIPYYLAETLLMFCFCVFFQYQDMIL